jgi:hypothetical protein
LREPLHRWLWARGVGKRRHHLAREQAQRFLALAKIE